MGRVDQVLDKLDNMFTLCLNPDQMKHELYLLHIKKFIMPLVEKLYQKWSVILKV